MGFSRQEYGSGLPFPPLVNSSGLFCQNSSLWPGCLGWVSSAWLIALLSYASPFTTTRLWSTKGERERYTHLSAGFQRIAKRDKEAFLNEQGKETEENNRMGKTSDLFKKTGDIKGIFHAKMGTIKERNIKDLTEAEGIKKRWQDYTEKLYKKGPNDPDDQWLWSLT